MLLSLDPLEHPVGKTSLEQAEIHRPLRKYVAQYQIALALRGMLECAHERAEEDRGRVPHDRVPPDRRERTAAKAPQHCPRKEELGDGAQCEANVPDWQGSQPEDTNTIQSLERPGGSDRVVRHEHDGLMPLRCELTRQISHLDSHRGA